MNPDENTNLTIPEEPETPETPEKATGAGKPESTSAPTDPAARAANEEADPTEGEETAETDGAVKQAKKIEWNKERAEKLVEKRLQRDRAVREQEFSQAAGIRMTHEDAKKASALWGFLLANPEINEALGKMVEQGRAQGGLREVPQASPVDERQKALDLKEAVLDLRLKDSIFRDNERDILEWAEINDYEIDDPRTLRLAVLAWKGENIALVTAKTSADKAVKEAAAQKAKDDAQLLPGRGTRSQKPVDYKNASAKDILKAENLSLFTNDPE